MKPLDRVLQAFEKTTGVPAIPSGNGHMGCCPCHDDDKPSVSVTEAANGKVLINCFAGCNTQDIVTKIGLKMPDLFQNDFKKQGREIEAVYQYFDADGKLQYEKVRYTGKKFVQRRPDGNGGWVWGLKAGWYSKKASDWHPVKDARDPQQAPSADAKWFPDVPHILYRQQQVIVATSRGDVILYVEGEKDADNADKIGLAATTAGGASEPWRDEFGENLRGAKLIFIPDADDAGRKLFEKYAPQLARYVTILHRLDLPEGYKDLSDYLDAGHTRAELDALIAAAPQWEPQILRAEILDDTPVAIRRPLCIVGGTAYLTTWVSVRLGAEDAVHRVVLRDDGQLFVDQPVPGAKILAELGCCVELPHVPDPSQLLSGAGLKRYMAGERPEPAKVFHRVRTIVDHFLDFGRSIGSQTEMTDLIALYISVTYLLDAFNVIGYLWPNGDKGVGKTKLLLTVTSLGYLGLLVLAGGSYASLRDLADYGACLGFDDAENVMDIRRSDPEKRTLLLAGNRRGAFVTLKEPCGDGWKDRRVHAFCPRLFSAIHLPDDVLASRTILVPLVRSSDDARANRDPSDFEMWPENRQRLIDDLWAVGLSNLTILRKYDRRVVEHVPLVGRNLEPWRAILAVALWLQEEHAVAGLFDRMVALAVRYQSERCEIEAASPVRVAILALQGMMRASGTEMIEFAPAELAGQMNGIAQTEELDHTGETFTTSRKVGLLLRQQRLSRAQRTATGKRWRITQSEVTALARAYGMVTEGTKVEGDLATKNAAENHGEPCRDAVSAVDAEPKVTPLTMPTSASNTVHASSIVADGGDGDQNAVCAQTGGTLQPTIKITTLTASSAPANELVWEDNEERQ